MVIIMQQIQPPATCCNPDRNPPQFSCKILISSLRKFRIRVAETIDGFCLVWNYRETGTRIAEISRRPKTSSLVVQDAFK